MQLEEGILSRFQRLPFLQRCQYIHPKAAVGHNIPYYESGF